MIVPVLLAFLQVNAHDAAVAAYKQHKFPEAVAQFTEALKTEQPGTAAYAESVLLLGQSLFFQNKFREAIPWLEKTLVTLVIRKISYALGMKPRTGVKSCPRQCLWLACLR